MPPAGTEEQFRFLISCIRFSYNGRIDFTSVADECHIVSKGAAAKRYERMMRANGIHPNGNHNQAQASRSAIPNPRQPRQKHGSASNQPKQTAAQKAALLDADAMAVDDDEELLMAGVGGMGVKVEEGEEVLVVKKEPVEGEVEFGEGEREQENVAQIQENQGPSQGHDQVQVHGQAEDNLIEDTVQQRVTVEYA